MKNKYKILLLIFILVFLFFEYIFTYYIPQPVIFVHGRGMFGSGSTGNNWDKIPNMVDDKDTDEKVLEYISKYGVICYFDSFKSEDPWQEGYGHIDNWGEQLPNWINKFRNQYENSPEHPEFTKFKIVGYSAGGLATRYYLANYPESEKLIERFVSLNSQHNGAYTAQLTVFAIDGEKIFGILTLIYLAMGFATSSIPNISSMYFTAADSCAKLCAAAWILKPIVSFAAGIPPLLHSSPLDKDARPQSKFFANLTEKEKTEKRHIKYRIVAGNGGWFNMGFSEAVVFNFILEMVAIPGCETLILPSIGVFLVLTFAQDGDYVATVGSQKGKDSWPFGKWYIWDNDIDKKIYLTNDDHKTITHRGDFILSLLDDPAVLAIENSNTLTAVKMEPDGCYVNIQKPEIHIDGSCDDYLIQWMGENNRVRLRYDRFSNIDEVIKLKNTEEGVFDYQRAGDVGRGWFSQKHTLQAGGENKIRIVAKNAADVESNKVKRTYYAVGLKYPSDNDEAVNMASPVVWKVLNKTTGEISRRFWNPSIDIGSFPEYVTQIADDFHIIGTPYVYDLNDEPNKDVEFESFDGVNLTIRLKNDYEKTVFKELEGNAEGPNYNKFEINYKVGPAYYDIDYAKHTDNPIDNPSVINPKYYTVNNVPSDLKQNYQGTI